LINIDTGFRKFWWISWISIFRPTAQRRQPRQWSTRSFRHAWTTVIPYWLVWTRGSYGENSPCKTPLHAL